MTETNSNATFYDKAVAYWNSLGDYQYFVWIIVVIVLLVLIVLVISVRNSRARSKELEEENALEREQMEQAQRMIEKNMRSFRNYIITWILVGIVIVRIAEQSNYHTTQPDPVVLQAYQHKALHENKVAELDKTIKTLKLPAIGSTAAIDFNKVDVSKAPLEKQYLATIQAKITDYDHALSHKAKAIELPKKGTLSDIAYILKYRHELIDAYKALDKATTTTSKPDADNKDQTTQAAYDASVANKDAIEAILSNLKALDTGLEHVVLSPTQLSDATDKAKSMYAPSTKENVSDLPEYLAVTHGLYSWNPFQSYAAFMRDVVGVVFFPSVGIEKLAELIYYYIAEYFAQEVIQPAVPAKA